MKQFLSIISLAIVLVACGPSQEDLDAAETNTANNKSATQTAEAPTSTPSPTLTLVPTSTFTPTPSPTPMPTPFGGGGIIAFSSNRDGNSNIYTINPDGSAVFKVTDFESDEFFPEFTHDGKFILFWVVDQTSSPPINEYRFISPDGTIVGYLLGGGGGFRRASFSPGGHEYVLAGNWQSGNDIINIDIIKAIPGKGYERLTTEPGNDEFPVWSPSGDTIAFVSYRDGFPTIYLMNTDGSEQRKLMDSDMRMILPAWSPDGTKIAFTSGTTKDTQIFIIDIDGTNLVQVTDELGFNEHPTWSPDGTKIAFFSDRSGNHDIFIINIDGSNVLQVTTSPFKDEEPSWSP